MRHGKCTFVPRDKYLRMSTINSELIIQKGSRVVQMIIAHKNFQIFLQISKMRAKNKVVLAVELGIDPDKNAPVGVV